MKPLILFGLLLSCQLHATPSTLLSAPCLGSTLLVNPVIEFDGHHHLLELATLWADQQPHVTIDDQYQPRLITTSGEGHWIGYAVLKSAPSFVVVDGCQLNMEVIQ